MDAETGLYYLRARYYDPATSRMLTEDSYCGEDENPLSLNRYTYCFNDPIQYVDPTGHITDWEKDFYEGKQGNASEYTTGGMKKPTQSENSGSNKSDTVTVTWEGYIETINRSELAKYESTAWHIFNGKTYTKDTYVGAGANVDFISTGDNSSSTIHNSGFIKKLITGNNSNTTINNRGIIDTINTGKSSSLTLYNSGEITAVKIGEESTAEIYNYNYIKNITGGNIADKNTRKGMYIENSGTIDHVLTGKNSYNLINNIDEAGGNLTLETGEGNDTIIIGGKKYVKIDYGHGNVYVRLYKYDINGNVVDTKEVSCNQSTANFEKEVNKFKQLKYKMDPPKGTGKDNPKIALVLGSVKATSSGYTTLYRAVSEAEFNQLMSTGKFDAGKNGLDVKFFAEKYNDAVTWGNKMNGTGNSRIIEVRVPNKTANDTEIFYRWDRLDSIGPARAAPVEEINNLDLKIIESNKKNDDDDHNNGTGSTGGGTGGTSSGIGFDFNGCYATATPMMGVETRVYVIGVSDNGTPLVLGSTLLGAKRIYESKFPISGYEGNVPSFMVPALKGQLPSVKLPKVEINMPKVNIPIPAY